MPVPTNKESVNI